MIIPKLQIGPLGAGLQKKLPHNRLWPRVGIYIADFHRINILDAMVRSDLMLDTPNFCDTLELGCGDETI